MAKVIDGKEVASEIRRGLAEKIQRLKEGGVTPGLAVIFVGEDPASQIYVRNKEKACEEIGINSTTHRMPEDTPQNELLGLISKLNDDPGVHGILVQLPIPKHMDEEVILRAISADKDVDGFHPINMGLLLTGQGGFKPCTPYGCIKMLDKYGIDIRGKKAVILGRSNIVGKPAALMLLHRDATVTICHSRTDNIAKEIREADILVTAVGKPEMIKGDMIKPGAVVLDVGINRLESGKLVGDVHYQSASSTAGWITPVPGGVGPMTITMLLSNTVEAAEKLC
ncbi:MAG: bifunctional methylenetetrahydrofolate dehydrogenase/methenyltetrahydrofolate cyclohydrolase FolD [Clostridia bacterium]|nr:bifunctional methylenetetrahydrofolate dehydrogenase/methenyltetrahydrofolate cyclohydrolase FolD [Clostridia bacterium]